MATTPLFADARTKFHTLLLDTIWWFDGKGIATNADKGQKASINIAQGILETLVPTRSGPKVPGQRAGVKFEEACAGFVDETFSAISHLRPGSWSVFRVRGRSASAIAKFDQYQHLIAVSDASRNNAELAAALGNDYTITPDVVVSREPETDDEINSAGHLVDDSVAKRSSLRQANNTTPILHASISCKWTLRSDRAQNARSEALNLIRNRKGRLPHVVVVTAEPMPGRIASLALGTGDIDCVYHFALEELIEVVKRLGYADSEELLDTMIQGKRLRDISDLPLDLAV